MGKSAALEERLNKTRSIKQGMMQTLLTGRVRLVKPEPASEQEARAVASYREGVKRMSTVGQREKRTQQRVVEFFTDALDYAYLGHWKNRLGNNNIEKEVLTDPG